MLWVSRDALALHRDNWDVAFLNDAISVQDRKGLLQKYECRNRLFTHMSNNNVGAGAARGERVKIMRSAKKQGRFDQGVRLYFMGAKGVAASEPK